MADRHRSSDGTRETKDLVPDAPTPSQQGRAQGNLERDVGTQDLMKRAQQGEDAGVTRVTKADEKGQGGLGGHHGTGSGGDED